MFFIISLRQDVCPAAKSVMPEFYKTEELIAAKERLLDDVNHLDPAVTLPHIPTRREGEARITRILDDIFTILTVVDENLRLKSLPKYVAESVDSMPALRLFDGDLAMLMDLLDKMNTRLSECGSSVAAMFSELLSLKEQVKLLSTSWPPLPRVSSAGEGGATGVGNSTGRKHKQSTARAPAATAPILKLLMKIISCRSRCFAQVIAGPQQLRPLQS